MNRTRDGSGWLLASRGSYQPTSASTFACVFSCPQADISAAFVNNANPRGWGSAKQQATCFSRRAQSPECEVGGGRGEFQITIAFSSQMRAPCSFSLAPGCLCCGPQSRVGGALRLSWWGDHFVCWLILRSGTGVMCFAL